MRMLLPATMCCRQKHSLTVGMWPLGLNASTVVMFDCCQHTTGLVAVIDCAGRHQCNVANMAKALEFKNCRSDERQCLGCLGLYRNGRRSSS